MGLDITAYQGMVRLMDWPAEVEGIDDIATYSGLDIGYQIDGKAVVDVHPSCAHVFPRHLGSLTPGIYAHGGRMHFRAGSYSGYNEWRDWLSRAALGASAEQVWRNFAAYEDRGVAWLVNFSDANGYIGPEISRRILDDIRAHVAQIRAAVTDSWYGEKLDQWIAALEMAADGGMLDFH